MTDGRSQDILFEIIDDYYFQALYRVTSPAGGTPMSRLSGVEVGDLLLAMDHK